MSQAFAEALSKLPLTRSFAATLARAHGYAAQQAHREVTLEHLLLALVEDAEASIILQSSQVDLNNLLAEISAQVGQIDDRFRPGEEAQPGVGADLLRILEYSGAAARQSKRGREINGAIVLAAIVGDGKSTSAHLLRAQGLTFEAAIKALQRPVAAAAPSAPAPLPPPARPPQPAAAPAYAPPAYTPPAAPPTPGEPRYAAQAPAPAPIESHPYSPPPGASYPATESTEDILASVRRRIDAGRPHQPKPSTSRPEPRSLQAEPRPPQAEQWPRQDPVAQATNEPPTPPPLSAPAASTYPPWPSGPETVRDIPIEPWTPADTVRTEAETAFPSSSPPPLPSPPEPRPISRDVATNLAEARALEQVAPPAAPIAHRRGAGGGLEAPGAMLHPIAPWPEVVAQTTQAEPLSRYAFDGNVAGAPYPVAEAPPSIPAPGGNGYEQRPLVSRPPARIMIDGAAIREIVPRNMRVGHANRVEATIAKSDLRLVEHGLENQAMADGHPSVVSKAISVRLYAPEGNAWVEPRSPETIWVEHPQRMARDDVASWAWNVIPSGRGPLELTLTISAHTVGPDGTTAVTTLPERSLTSTAAIEHRALALSTAKIAALLLIGALTARYSGWLLAALGRLFG